MGFPAILVLLGFFPENFMGFSVVGLPGLFPSFPKWFKGFFLGFLTFLFVVFPSWPDPKDGFCIFCRGDSKQNSSGQGKWT